MLEFLKTILGENYSEDIDKKISEKIGKEFVPRTDFNQLNCNTEVFFPLLFFYCVTHVL